MKKNYSVKGTIGFFCDGVLHTCLEYTSAWQRDQIITDFLEKVKNIRKRVILYYVISIDEESIRFPKPSGRPQKNKKVIQEPYIRPKSEYSNKQWDEYYTDQLSE